MTEKRIKAAAAALPLAAAVVFIFFTKSGETLVHTNVKQLAEQLRSFGKFADLIAMLAVVVQMMVPYLPFVIIAGANVLMLGFWWGFTVNFSMSVFGGMLSFLFARYSARRWVQAKLRAYPQATGFNASLADHGFYYILLGRLIPVIPSTVINWASGVSKVSWKAFLLATAAGSLPMVFLESLIGHDLLHFRQHKLRLLIVLLLLSALILFGVRLKKRWLPAKS